MRSTVHFPAILSLVVLPFVLAAGCVPDSLRPVGIINPAVAELEQVQGLDRAGRAAHQPSCSLGAAGCDRVYEMTGDACLRLAQEGIASRSAAPHAACAAARYGSLRDAGIGGTALRGLEAARLVRESSAGGAGAANARLASLAGSVATPAAGYYRASATDWRAAFAGPVRCSDLRAAEADATRAAASPPSEGLDNRAASATLATRLAGRVARGDCSP